MQIAKWKEEILTVATKWPRGFRAELRAGGWRLTGAPESVKTELRKCADRIARELRFPRGDADAVTALLYRLKESRYGVRATQVRMVRKGVDSSRLQVEIQPLRNSLIRYVRVGPCANPSGNVRSSNPAQDSGQAAAAQKNRVRTTRLAIVAALHSLALPESKWPGCVRQFKEHLREYPEYSQPVSPAPFEPPVFDRLNQSPEEWSRAADREWQIHRDDFLRQRRVWVGAGVDEEIPAMTRTRSRGFSAARNSRRTNSTVERRYQWAAHYLCGVPLKEIDAQRVADPSTVGKIARGILQQAGWLKRRQRRGAAAPPNK